MRKKNLALVGLFLFAAFIGCCSFPALNLTKEPLIRLDMVGWINLAVVLGGYSAIGQAQEKLFLKSSMPWVVFFNLMAVAVGLGGRYLLEFGEVSNTDNFTGPNILLHLVVAVGLSCVQWWFAVKQREVNGVE